ncbi:CadD family cadmium resistance transporter [Marinococcus halophilus]|uniref:CadD family cadmium resistance transporter n=1 Tax=Marinococcus halophilus TaxID=1371 RepID=UPI0009A64261|nr:CadD family cadmium resistance transporter [Marinococcus halophilus]
MLTTIGTASVLYLATAIDLVVLLLLFFGQANTKKQYGQVYLGQYMGSLVLIGASLLFAFVLRVVPEDWMLGLLGLIPLYLGIKIALMGDEDDVDQQLHQHQRTNLSTTVALIVIASCGADNISLFVPYFVSISVPALMTTLATFAVWIVVLVFSAQQLSRLPGVSPVIEHVGRWVMVVIYIGLGFYVLILQGTVAIVWSWITG